MERITKEGKDLETVLNAILEENNLEKEDIVYTSCEKKGKLFQGNLIEVTLMPKTSIYDEVKSFLKEVIEIGRAHV